MHTQPDISGVHLVLLGSFNPVIFTPAWFALHGLLSEEDVGSAELRVAHNQVTDFQSNWFNLQVTPDRFSIETMIAPHIRIRDLVVRVFGEFLSHTPVKALGINSGAHVKAQDKEELNRIGTALAPPSAWGPWQEKLDLDCDSGGMSSLKMSQLSPDERPTGSAINITVEPSKKMGRDQLGVYIAINHHFQIDTENADSSRSLMRVFDQYYDNCIEMSNEIVDHIMSLGHENQGEPMALAELATLARHESTETSTGAFDPAIDLDDPVKPFSNTIDLASRNRFGAPRTSPDISENGQFSGRTNEEREQDESNSSWAEILPRQLPKPAVARSSLHALQEWEGYVIEILETEFVARLTDITAKVPIEDEEAVFPLEEITDADFKKLRPGSIFRWVIGYERSGAGTKKRVSQIVFRDLPVVTRPDVQDGKAWAEETLGLLNP